MPIPDLTKKSKVVKKVEEPKPEVKKVEPVKKVEEPKPEVKKVEPVEKPRKDVKDVMATHILLVNPFTQVRAVPNVTVNNVVVDSWWESQVKAGLAKWM